MKINLLTRRELETINRQQLRYPLAVAEKDYLLAVVSKIIYGSPLRDKIVFKGGTAIHHCYISQSRFSEDLDFTSLDKNITLEEVKAVLESQDFLEVKKEYVSGATIKIERLKYAGPLNQPNSLKVEIDYMQNVVLPAKDITYKNAWGVKTKVKVMDVKEICAEKIRASSDRARYRDFYDLAVLMDKFKFKAAEINHLIGQKEIRKPITKASIRDNWSIAKKEKKREIDAIYYSVSVSDAVIEKMLAELRL
ncbi:MAG: nucleotidyl transferase AbiEii/AbiGii toxin family protein [Candidatus Omnitrophota bacterium]|jgi:predicted nucleotidyltransferase component of viral defense system